MEHRGFLGHETTVYDCNDGYMILCGKSCTTQKLNSNVNYGFS